jgi:hypothetical protein
MKKEEMIQEINSNLSTLKDQATALTNLVNSLQMTVRSGDVSFQSLDEAGKLLNEFKENPIKQTVEKVHKTLKARAVARVKET